ncbi:cytochrome c6 PetJ [Kamptonema formosum]|uniref:cytochrome c6 PetJ n=1 Tax=Kamptonema formosum TaxID=331992 RepID=UPI000475619A|nr:c-type cytochrome [Oscillatoria sp. PCC 10802]
MKRLLSAVLIALAALTVFTGQPALADGAAGAKIFSANCTACHAGGGNVVMRNKTLKKEALEKYKMNSAAAIIKQVTNGKNAMPAFKGRLNAKQIEDVAAYVLDQSAKDWK